MASQWTMDLDDDDVQEGHETSSPEDIDYEEIAEDLEETLQEQAESQEQAEQSHSSSVNDTLRTILAGGQPNPRLSRITLQQLGRLLGVTILPISRDEAHDYEDEDDEDDDEDYSWGRPRRQPRQWFPPVTEPQQAGVELLMSGEFGRVGPKTRRRNVARYLLKQGNSPRPIFNKQEVCGYLVPNSPGSAVASYEKNAYCGQYSKDSTFYYTCGQDFRLRVYDTTAPLKTKFRENISHHNDPEHQTTMSVIKSVRVQPGRWTITDSHLSPDNERMIYASITPTVYMTSTRETGDPTQIPIQFADLPSRRRPVWGWDSQDEFGIWSCKFSADGNEVIAGGSGKIFVYDLLANKRTVKIPAHTEDVNSCCWADTASGNVLISASDDTFIKVWDRRSLGSSKKPSGVLVGHTEGITNVSAKGDGRYVVSNGKDQAMRLWDLRKMHSSTQFDRIAEDYYGITKYDYRDGYYPEPRHPAHPQDCSVMTYRGHAVLRTLIRCHFSPTETTGGQYLYSGSADGRIHIWSLDGRIVQILDRSLTLPMTFDPSGPEPDQERSGSLTACVRDVSWHSQQPVLMSVGWESRGGSTVVRHEWKGLSKMSNRVEDWVEKSKQEQGERKALRVQRVPGAFENDEE